MRVGIVLTVTFNLPLKSLSAAALRRHASGFGDITLTLAGSDRIAWLQLWPSVRPWRVTRPEPTLRGVADAQAVAEKVTLAWKAAVGSAAQAALPTANAATATPAAESALPAAPASVQQWRASPT